MGKTKIQWFGALLAMGSGIALIAGVVIGFFWAKHDLTDFRLLVVGIGATLLWPLAVELWKVGWSVLNPPEMGLLRMQANLAQAVVDKADSLDEVSREHDRIDASRAELAAYVRSRRCVRPWTIVVRHGLLK